MSFPTDPRSKLNIEQQRKRAKDLRRAHGEGSLDAAVRIAGHLPRARNQSPEQVLASAFSLSEAQLVVAREAGFSSWPKLKHHIGEEERGRAGSGASIIDAAFAGEDDAVRRLLAENPDAPQRSIHVAAAVADGRAVFSLLDADPSLADRRDERRNWTPLLHLGRSRYRQRDGDATTARTRIGQRLLQVGADVNEACPESGFASWNVTLFDQEEWYAIDVASAYLASGDVVRLLLDSGADLSKTGAVLSQAVRGGSVDVLQLLLAASPPDWQVGWALKACVFLERPDMARILVPHLTSPRVPEAALIEAIRLERGPGLIEILLGDEDDHPLTLPTWRRAYRAALRYGHAAAVDVLRRRGADEADVTDEDRVIAACVHGNAADLRRLLDGSAYSKAALREDEHRMLAWAVRTGRYHAVPLFLDAGFDPAVPDVDGETPLHLAVRRKSLHTVEALLRAGSPVGTRNFEAETPLDVAVSNSDRAARELLVRRLLEAGARPAPDDARLDREEMDLLFERAADAVALGDLETLRELLDAEPFLVHARSPRPHRATLFNYCGANGVENARQRTPPNAPAIARLLLERGADANATCNLYGGGATTLGLLLTSIHPMRAGLRTELMEIMVAAGANIGGARGPEGIVGAAALGRLDLVERFFGTATGPQVADAFLWACEYGRQSVVEFLLDKGADLHAQNGYGLTGLHLAAVSAQLETVKLLLRRAADLERRNIWGGTVLANTLWGAANWDPNADYPSVVETLINAGAKVEPGFLPWWMEQKSPAPTAKARIEALLREQLE